MMCECIIFTTHLQPYIDWRKRSHRHYHQSCQRNHRRPANILFVDSVVVVTIAVAVGISVSPPETSKKPESIQQPVQWERQ